MTVNQEAHKKLMADLKHARDGSLGETRTLLRRAIARLETLNDLCNEMLEEKKGGPRHADDHA